MPLFEELREQSHVTTPWLAADVSSKMSLLGGSAAVKVLDVTRQLTDSLVLSSGSASNPIGVGCVQPAHHAKRHQHTT